MGVSISPSIAAHRAVIVRAEVGRQRQHTWGREQGKEQTCYKRSYRSGKASLRTDRSDTELKHVCALVRGLEVF